MLRLRDVVEGTKTLGKRPRGRRRPQLIEKKNYTDLKKEAKDRSIWRTIRTDCQTCFMSRHLKKKVHNLLAVNSYQLSNHQQITAARFLPSVKTDYMLLCLITWRSELGTKATNKESSIDSSMRQLSDQC